MSEIVGRAGGPRDVGQLAEDTAALQADVDGARWLRRHMAAGAAIVSTVTDGGFRATTVNTCISTSLDPPLFLVSIERDSQMEDWLLQSAVFGISVLPWSEQFAADQFAGFTPLASSTFRGIDHFTSLTGAPLLTRCLAWADCRLVQNVLTGDHRCFIGEAVALGRGQGNPDQPLVSYVSRYRSLR